MKFPSRHQMPIFARFNQLLLDEVHEIKYAAVCTPDYSMDHQALDYLFHAIYPISYHNGTSLLPCQCKVEFINAILSDGMQI